MTPETQAHPASPQSRVAVVGAGIVGTCIAYELRKRGLDVTLIDRDEPGRGCSFGNSGAISPGSVAPLAMPGIMAAVPAMLRDPEGPLHLPLGYLLRATPWLLRFVAAARPSRVAAIADQLAALHRGAVARHLALAQEVGVPELILQRGHLHLYPDARAFAKDAAAWQLREAHGYRVERLDRTGILALEPDIPARDSRRYDAAAGLALQRRGIPRRPCNGAQSVSLCRGDRARVQRRGRPNTAWRRARDRTDGWRRLAGASR